MIKNIKKHFPLFSAHPNLVYLDSAATSQTPQEVLDAMNEYYTSYRANIHRGMYDIAEQATEAFENARKKVAQFIHAETDEIIFTRSATESLNLACFLLHQKMPTNCQIAATVLEHHSLYLPLDRLARQHQHKLRLLPLTANFTAIDLPRFGSVVENKPTLLGITQMSNVLGIQPRLNKMIPLVHASGGLVIVDAAQSVVHQPINVKKLDCDALAFSGHKMFGPTGIGVLYLARKHHKDLEPFILGGGMINDLNANGPVWEDIPHRFEYGTPPIAESIGLAAAIDFIQRIGFQNLQKHEKDLSEYAHEKLRHVPGITLLSPEVSPVKSFILPGIHPHDVASILNEHHVAIRAGHHCTKPLMNVLELPATARMSLSMYNTRKDIDRLVKALKHAQKIFSNV